MVKITIIGWYGTETIGDRAILAGLLSLLKGFVADIEIRLGCLYPFFTERTLLEEEDFFNKCSGYNRLPVTLFDSSSPREMDNAIRKCDWLVVGGGPLEDIPCMFMLEYALIKARKMNKRTMILGCGIGPLYKKIYQKSMLQIVQHADICVFRDKKSQSEYERLSGITGTTGSAIDPAVFAIEAFKQYYPQKQQNDEIVISVRDFPVEYKINKNIDEELVNKRVSDFIHRMYRETGRNIVLIPMHYWGIGDDDRYFMNKLCLKEQNRYLQVQNNPLNTVETMMRFRNAFACVGMRYHSVVFQTLLNGRNIVLDYTDPQTGKIGNFLQQMKAIDYYKNSYLNLQTDSPTQPEFPRFPFLLDATICREFRENYFTCINQFI